MQIFEKHQDLQAVVIDFIDVKHADLSGLFALKEVMSHAKKQKMAVFLSNVIPEVQHLLTKADVSGDDITLCSADLQEAIRAAIAVTETAAVDSIDVESLGLVQDLLRVTKSNSLLELATWSAAKENSAQRETMIRDSIGIELSDIKASKSGETYSMIPTIEERSEEEGEGIEI